MEVKSNLLKSERQDGVFLTGALGAVYMLVGKRPDCILIESLETTWNPCVINQSINQSIPSLRISSRAAQNQQGIQWMPR